MATFGDIMQRVMVRLSAMGGLDVQTYMQPKIAEMIRYRYDSLFTKRFWRDTVTTEEMTIDPLTGLVIADISAKIKRFIDIKSIIPDGHSRALPERRTNRSSQHSAQMSFEPYALDGKIFRILPLTTNPISVYEVTFRTQQTSWLETDQVLFDDQLIIMGVCADYSVGEGANMEMAKNFQAMFTERYRDLVHEEMKYEKSLYAGETPGIYEWH